MEATLEDKYVRINPRYKLRGWLGQPYALLDSLRAVPNFVPKAVFETLRMCNGRFRVSDAVFFGARGRYLDMLEHDGVLVFGCAVKPACPTVRSSMYLGPDGCILPCSTMSHDDAVKGRFPNIADTTLAEALTDSSYLDLVCASVGDVFERNPKCQACIYRGRCRGGCRAKGKDDEGRPDPMGLDHDACRYFLGGFYDRARELVEILQADTQGKGRPRSEGLAGR